MEAGEPQPRHGGAPGVLHALRRLHRRRRRGLFPRREFQPHVGRGSPRRGRPRRLGPQLGPPRHVDRPRERRPDDRGRRRRRFNLAESRQDVVPRSAPGCPALPRDRRQPGALLRLCQPPGRAVGARPQQQPHRNRHHAWDVARGGRRRERLRHARHDAAGHHLVERLGVGRRQRDRRALQRAHPPVSQRRGMAGELDRLARRPDPLPLPVDVPAAHLAARPQHRLRHQPARAPHHERRPELGGHQPRPHHQRHDEDGDLRRPHPGQSGGRVLLRDLRAGRVAARAGAAVGGHQRRSGPDQPRRRCDVGRRDEEHPEPAAAGHRS